MSDGGALLRSAWNELEARRLRAEKESRDALTTDAGRQLAQEMIAHFLQSMDTAGNPGTVRCQLRRLKGRGGTFQAVPGAFVTGWIVTWMSDSGDEVAVLDTAGIFWAARQISARQWAVHDPSGAEGLFAHPEPQPDMAMSLAGTMHEHNVSP